MGGQLRIPKLSNGERNCIYRLAIEQTVVGLMEDAIETIINLVFEDGNFGLKK